MTELASFNNVKYWDGFYDPEQGGDLEEFDWYSTEEWLPECVENIAAQFISTPTERPLSFLDVGVGTCPLIFELVRRTNSAVPRWSELVGIDFVQSAMDAMAARAAEEFGGEDVDVQPAVTFLAADACDMSKVLGAGKAFDVVFDKGCMDCFVSGDGEGDLAKYLKEVAAVVAPHGRALFVSVNGADVAHMLRSGGAILREDAHSIQPAAGNLSSYARAKWQAKKQPTAAAAADAAASPLVLESIHAYEQKHCYVCRLAAVAPSQLGERYSVAGAGACCEVDSVAPVPLYCGHCGRSWLYPEFPPECPRCANKLQRFALS